MFSRFLRIGSGMLVPFTIKCFCWELKIVVKILELSVINPWITSMIPMYLNVFYLCLLDLV